jgi:hypothetical protein
MYFGKKFKLSDSFMQYSLCVCIFVLIHSLSHGCNIPVFRYAFENWKQSDYTLHVLYEKELNPEEVKLIEYLKSHDSNSKTPFNYKLEIRDVLKDDIPENIKNLLKNENLPIIIAEFPVPRSGKIAWKGDFSEQNVKNLLNSPVRKKIAESLNIEGTCCFLLLSGGDIKQDDLIYTALYKKIKILEETTSSVDQSDTPNFNEEEEDRDISLKYSILRLSPDDTAERIFTGMLMNTEDDLHEYKGKTMVFPIYGRGIALYALVGDGITDENIQETAKFLAGPCSCEIKDGNPGIDLLMSCEWESASVNGDTVQMPEESLSGLGTIMGDESLPESDHLSKIPENRRMRVSVMLPVVMLFIITIIALSLIFILRAYRKDS